MSKVTRDKIFYYCHQWYLIDLIVYNINIFLSCRVKEEKKTENTNEFNCHREEKKCAVLFD